LIHLNNISKIYRMGEVNVIALKNIDMKIQRGEFISIIGPSGSGKSTLLHTLGLLDVPTTGQYLLEDVDVSRLSDRELSRIRNRHFGFVFQTFNLLPDFTALENVTIPMIYSKVPVRERKSRAKELLEQMGLGHRIRHYPNQLSGGEQQRVAIARALANNPTLILADEPTGNLNTKQGDEIMDIFRNLNEKGVTIVMVTHSPRVSEYAKRVITLRDGEIVSDEAQVREIQEDVGTV
jgi:putative ABC transport system ATP-binding protein